MPRCAHKYLPPSQRHAIHAWEVADRDARMQVTPGECDLYKMALQLDNMELYMLVSLEPLIWKRTSDSHVSWDSGEW